jgi:hypothetical protein
VKYPLLEIIPNAGWHFNNLFPSSIVITKIRNSSHVEWNTEQIRSKAMDNYFQGQDIYTGKKFTEETIDETYPECIVKNIQDWQDYIFKIS